MDSIVPRQAAAPVRWAPDRNVPPVPWPVPPTLVALARGARCVCPACGQGKLFRGYLRVTDACPHCGAPLGRARADDAPPYFTMLVVGHIMVPATYLLDRAYDPPMLLEGAIVLPLVLALTLLLLRPIKGATVGLMLGLGMLQSDQDE